MTVTQPALWATIRDYVFPIDSGGRTFEEQLIAEHRINRVTAEAAITEYRRFLYLSAISEGRTVPSKAVDAVWHLHLGHTRDYWERFCDRIGKRLHHTPGTPRGHSEDFRATLVAYREEFGTAPPAHYWGGTFDLGLYASLLSGALLLAASTATGVFEPPMNLVPLAAGVALLLSTVPGICRRLGLIETPALVNKPIVSHRSNNNGGGGCGADCGGGCGGD